MKNIYSFFLLWLIYQNAFSQFTFNSNITALYDDNIDNNHLQITDRITSGEFDIGYIWSKSRYEVGISYIGSINYFTKLIERTNYSHQVLLGYSQSLDNYENTNLEASIGATTRLDRGDFKLYDHTIYYGKIDFEHYLSELTILETNFYVNLVRFKNLSDFNHTEYDLGIQLSISFESRTSLIIRTDLGNKVYASQTSTVTTGQQGSNGLGQGQGGQSTTTSTTQTSSAVVTQLSGMIRIGQSIFKTTGISLTAQYQTNLKKESRYFASSYGSIPDDIIFDDHYGYEGPLISIMLTQIMPLESKARLIYSFQNRTYSTLPAYDLNWNLVADKRIDKRSVYSLQLQKEFDNIGLTITGTYNYIINSSNDKFYDYINNAITIGISLLL